MLKDQQAVMESSQKPLYAEIEKLEGEKQELLAEIDRLQALRQKQEETVKQAFLRGVCALNLEAMQMFHLTEAEKSQVIVSQPKEDDFFQKGSQPAQPASLHSTSASTPLYRQPPPPVLFQQQLEKQQKQQVAAPSLNKQISSKAQQPPAKITKPKVLLKQGIPTNPTYNEAVSAISNQRIGKTTVQVTRHCPTQTAPQQQAGNKASSASSGSKWNASAKLDI